MFLPTYKTALQTIHEQELAEFKTKYIKSFKSSTADESFIDGNVQYKIPINRTAVKELIDSYRYPINEDYKDDALFKNVKDLTSNVTSKVLTIPEPKTIQEALEFAVPLIEKAGKNFYGMLLRDNENPDIIMNPLHPLTTISLLANPSYLDKKYKVLLYFYSNRAKVDSTYNTSYGDLEAIKQNINAMLLNFNNKLKNDTRLIGIEAKSETSFRLIHKVKKHPDEHKSYAHYLVTHQIVNQGIIAPYYGASIVEVRDNFELRGIHCSPMRSCNIASDTNTSNSTEPLSSASNSYGSVCIGSSPRNLEGLRSISHSNLGSPYNRKNILDGALLYADYCIYKSLELFAKASLCPMPALELTPKPEAEFTEAELECMTLNAFRSLNSNISMKDCIAKYKRMKTYQAKLERTNDDQENSTENEQA